MLPFILGAVALGATGYGVKKYIESDTDRAIAFDETVINTAIDICEGIDDFEFKYLVPSEFAIQRDKDGKFQCIDDNHELNDEESEIKIKHFHTLKQKVYESSYKEFQSQLQKIQNLNIDELKKVQLNDNIPLDNTNLESINDISSDLYYKLIIFDNIFKAHITQISNILAVSNDYSSYTDDVKKLVSDTLVLANFISDILNVKVINKEGKISKSVQVFVKESSKFMDTIAA